MSKRIAELLMLVGVVMVCLSAMPARLLANPLGIPDSEYDALVALYNSTGGPDWTDKTNWLTDEPYWYGVSSSSGHVTSLNLFSNNLSGSLPAELGDLPELTWIDLSDNHIAGPIPETIVGLTNVWLLRLQHNRLSGQIPSDIGSMTQLWSCELSGNALIGEVPSSVTNLTGLVQLNLDNNALSCSDPAVLSFLSPVSYNWQSSQTVPPSNVAAQRMGSGSIRISWEPHQSWPAGYCEVGYSQTPGGPYTFDAANRTEDKWRESLWIEDPAPTQPVYLVVRTVAPPHYSNQSTLISLNSAEAAPGSVASGSKLAPDGASVSFANVIVTAAFADCCYFESEGRAWGMRAESPYGGYPDPGTRAEAFGVLSTNADGERCLIVDNGRTTGSGAIRPMGMTNRALGGGNYSYDPDAHTGQMGVTGGTGLNNIGMLVRTSGACTLIDDHTFTINDGSGMNVRCETPPSIMVSPAWQHVSVTGISSIRKTGETYERLLKVTEVRPIISGTPEGITGRWEMTSTSGNLAGVIGLLLVQRGEAISGSALGCGFVGGQMTGNVFTGSFEVDDTTVESHLTRDGDTLSGTWTAEGDAEVYSVTFSRVSPDPVSPYVGRPKVLAAWCNGRTLDVVWDRPIVGWDYDIRTQYGESITDSSDGNTTYDPSAHVYHIPIHTWKPMYEGERYTVVLAHGDEVEWCDPYGAAAWSDSYDAYSFDFTFGSSPPSPGLVLGYHTSGMPTQWVTISASWPQGYGLKLYQSADCIAWHPMAITPTKRGGNGDFTFELWSNTYFRATATGPDGESLPSAIVHARPSEVEVGAIAVDAPAQGASGVSLVPTISWHPVYTQQATVTRYAPKVIDVATGSTVWSPLTSVTPPRTTLLYGQTNGVIGMPAAGPLEPNKTYAVRVGAFDTENWMFASSPEIQFTTTAESGPPEGVTGRWEMTSTSGETSGVLGLLLSQQGSTVTGTAVGSTISNGQVVGNVLTGEFCVPDRQKAMTFSMVVDGDTMTGTMSDDEGDAPYQLEFHRISPVPMSPYVGRPQVLSATCDGTSIDVTWDRPVLGWDYDIIDEYGQSLAHTWDLDRSYDPDTHTYHIALDPSSQLLPGHYYTIYLEDITTEKGEDPVDWHDPYGVAAWDRAGWCYRFYYWLDGPPPPPPGL